MQSDGITVLVPLNKRNFKGVFAMIDIADVDLVLPYSWSLRPGTSTLYATRHVKETGKSIYLHIALMSPPDGMEVDHRNGNGLDNRRKNLRAATRAENARNVRGTGRSGYKGVQWFRNRWNARIKIDGKLRSLGVYDTPEEAAAAYDAAALAAWGEFAWLNFPHDLHP